MGYLSFTWINGIAYIREPFNSVDIDCCLLSLSKNKGGPRNLVYRHYEI